MNNSSALDTKVFIDANTYIKMFVGYPSKEYLDKIEQLLKDNKFILVFPRITREEVYREVAEILKDESENPTLKMPEILDIISGDVKRKLKGLEEDYMKVYRGEHKKQVALKKDMASKLFSVLGEMAKDYDDSSIQYKQALERKAKRYSPGKSSNPLGDQLVWELLKDNCNDADLIIVSSDGDWRDLINTDIVKANPFLIQEWEKRSKKNIKLFNDLSGLIKVFDENFKTPKEEMGKEKLAPSHPVSPWLPVSPSLSPSAYVGTPSIGTTFTVVESPPSVLSGSPGFLPKSTQCVDCGKNRDSDLYSICKECRQRRGIF